MECIAEVPCDPQQTLGVFAPPLSIVALSGLLSCVLFEHTVFLAGQSAGSHLAACALVKQAQKEVLDDPSNLSWSSCQLWGFIAISGR
jgi:hypothetical protein